MLYFIWRGEKMRRVRAHCCLHRSCCRVARRSDLMWYMRLCQGLDGLDCSDGLFQGLAQWIVSRFSAVIWTTNQEVKKKWNIENQKSRELGLRKWQVTWETTRKCIWVSFFLLPFFYFSLSCDVRWPSESCFQFSCQRHCTRGVSWASRHAISNLSKYTF